MVCIVTVKLLLSDVLACPHQMEDSLSGNRHFGRLEYLFGRQAWPTMYMYDILRVLHMYECMSHKEVHCTGTFLTNACTSVMDEQLGRRQLPGLEAVPKSDQISSPKALTRDLTA